MNCKNREVVLANIYAPNCDDPSFFVQLFQEIENLNPENMIICGDFNLVMDPLVDKSGSINNHDKSLEIVNAYLEERQLIDVWCMKNPDLKHYSWFRLLPKPVFCRLDMIVMSTCLANVTVNVEYKPGFRTDHSSLMLTIEISSMRRGHGYWKLNSSHLQNDDFKTLIKEKISTFNNACKIQSKADRWEMLKEQMITTCMDFSNELAKHNNQIM